MRKIHNPFKRKAPQHDVEVYQSPPVHNPSYCVAVGKTDTPKEQLTDNRKAYAAIQGKQSQLTQTDIIGTTIINLILQSAYTKHVTDPDYHPLSLLILGKAGTGKSRLLKTMHTLKKKYLEFVYYTDSITPKHLIEFLHKAETGEKRFLVIPDFQVITHSHGRKTYGTSISIIRQLISDGISSLDDYGMEFHPDHLVKAGLITATTIKSYAEFANAWKKDGFLSRLIPFSFIHGTITQETIMKNIAAKFPDTLRQVKYAINKNPVIPKDNGQFYLQLRGYATPLGDKTESLPYRALEQLIGLTEMLAIIEGANEITQHHIDTIIKLLSCINYDFNSI